MLTINDLVKDFNPTAELKVIIDDEEKPIVDLGWNSVDYKTTLEGIKNSKQNTNCVYLYPEYKTKVRTEKLNYEFPQEHIDYDYVQPKCGGWTPKNGYFVEAYKFSPSKIRINETPTTKVVINEIPYLNSDKVVLSCKFKVKKIFYTSALVKKLNIECGNLLTIDYELFNTSTGNSPGSQCATIYNANTGLSCTKTLNSLAKMINEGLEIYRIA